MGKMTFHKPMLSAHVLTSAFDQTALEHVKCLLTNLSILSIDTMLAIGYYHMIIQNYQMGQLFLNATGSEA